MSVGKIIWSLFDYSGNWCKPYKENGYTVLQVDLKLGIDILTWNYQDLPKPYGILAAIPCTDFAWSGARWFSEKDADGRTEKSILLVRKTLEIINWANPDFYAIENPRGRINKLVPELGCHLLEFNPCDFGDPYKKPTRLWGKFNPILFKTPVEPMSNTDQLNPISQPRREDGSKIGWHTEEAKEKRSITPLGFSYSFFNSNS